jgi:hypothetical protein
MLAVRAALAGLACAPAMPAHARDAATVEHGRQVFKTEISEADLAALAAYLAPRKH